MDSRDGKSVSLTRHFSLFPVLRICGALLPPSLSSCFMRTLILMSLFLVGKALRVWVIGVRRFGTAYSLYLHEFKCHSLLTFRPLKV